MTRYGVQKNRTYAAYEGDTVWDVVDDTTGVTVSCLMREREAYRLAAALNNPRLPDDPELRRHVRQIRTTAIAAARLRQWRRKNPDTAARIAADPFAGVC